MDVDLVIEQNGKELKRLKSRLFDGDIADTDDIASSMLRDREIEIGYYDVFAVSPGSVKRPGLHGDYKECDLHAHDIRIA